ncbi:hypothetical protein [Cellulomonas alba]|uniref:Uncharacterized protein n=1 Tax=Cellulomonas alba TaxID=3053467 RepID=A0ABT7SBT7_9CELL|nr:hypothetical protein [Cellulomonas alba]MDM7853648.1 hypothetical protein [Cellulomonas alba]
MPDRTYYDTLDDAMAALGVPVESRPLARDLTPRVPSEFWIPAKSTYIAVRPQGERVVKTYVNRGFVDRWVAPRRYERTHIVGGVADGPYER